MWLSLVERCVRDAETGGSNPLIPTRFQRGLRWHRNPLSFDDSAPHDIRRVPFFKKNQGTRLRIAPNFATVRLFLIGPDQRVRNSTMGRRSAGRVSELFSGMYIGGTPTNPLHWVLLVSESLSLSCRGSMRETSMTASIPLSLSMAR
jgi:hypothetical protein